MATAARSLPTVVVGGACVCLGMTLATSVSAQTQPSIVGTWEWVRSSNHCAEQYQFHGDGTVLIFSGAAVSESKYRMAWAPEPNGRYKLVVTNTKREGGADCSGTKTETPGEEHVFYILFGGSRQTMILCNSPADADCIGPLKRSAT